MSKGKKGSWDIPTREKTGVLNFANPYAASYYKGNGQGKKGGTYGFNFTSEGKDYFNKLSSIRDAIMSELGYTSPSREASLNRWQKTFSDEALRTSMPQLEQTLFSRGLGGSEFYKGAVTDLLNKIAVQSVLNREDLANRDEILKLNQLNTINPEVWKMLNMGGDLAKSGANLTEEQYERMLPYMATYQKPKKGTWDLVGGGAGAAIALGLAPFTGGASLAYLPMAASLGQSVGGMFNEQQGSGLDLGSMANLALKAMNYGG